MCGIAGFFFRHAVPKNSAMAALSALRQRGPDAERIVTWNADFVRNAAPPQAFHNALLHARLSIIDPRPVAHQPMCNPDETLWLCYNGEIYGYEKERAQLEAQGVVFQTHADSEFILRAYETWGIDALLPMLRGMFALAILDLRQQKLHLIRDRFGEKPLLYALDGENLAFASLVRSLLPLLPPTSRAFDPEAIDAYLAHRYIPAPATVFSSMRRLENGHRLEFDLQTRRLVKVRYWHPRAEASPWLPELDASVRMRTVADRPLGVLLSGGVDSNVVASRLARQELTQFSTFTAAFPGTSHDESGRARKNAEILGLDNHSIIMPSALGEDFERIVADLDQPFSDPSSLPTWYLAREVSAHVKVVLVGDGGDELFGGYKRIHKHLSSAWRQGFRLPLPIPSSLNGKGASKWISEMAMDWIDAYSLRFSGFTPAQRRFLHGGSPVRRLCYWRPADEPGSTTPIEQLSRIDFANYLPEYILQKSDLCTMAHGLEARAPFLDAPFYQCLLPLPDSERYTRPAKLLLREALDPRLIDPVFSGKKRGFNPPLTAWLRNDLAPRRDGLGARLAALTRGQLDAAAIDRFADAYFSGREALAEQMLQLFILDVSLGQLQALADTYPSPTPPVGCADIPLEEGE
ncbi:MAG: asparagine synthase (glutamine-hydrolyzing) [Betaproteobacteria bacterium]|nr:asparagine synthase (glutamine-hydrolyzing) [Betaproteobacteria bacterium]